MREIKKTILIDKSIWSSSGPIKILKAHLLEDATILIENSTKTNEKISFKKITDYIEELEEAKTKLISNNSNRNKQFKVTYIDYSIYDESQIEPLLEFFNNIKAKLINN